ncbi:hypothetical protein ACVGVM_08985 [Pseudonocardia bannensis]|nr:hypothetical protein [Pseudonocardia bannensis]
MVSLPATLVNTAVSVADAGLALQRKLWRMVLPGFGSGEADRRS